MALIVDDTTLSPLFYKAAGADAGQITIVDPASYNPLLQGASSNLAGNFVATLNDPSTNEGNFGSKKLHCEIQGTSNCSSVSYYIGTTLLSSSSDQSNNFPIEYWISEPGYYPLVAKMIASNDGSFCTKKSSVTFLPPFIPSYNRYLCKM